jgi:Trk K+ transport system NAD-binding subunit
MKSQAGRRTLWRNVRAAWRDTLILLREFRLPLGVFLLLIAVAGTIYFRLSQASPEPLSSLAEGIYLVLSLSFFQPMYDFPRVWYLQVFFFLMPIVGISTLALGLADFATLFFNRRSRGKEWQMAVASTLSNHVVLVGLGHLGYRVVTHLKQLDQDVVVVEVSPKADLRHAVDRLDVPLIEDDATREVVLRSAGIERARTIMLCTQNDSLNLEVALKARGLNPQIDVVVRIFDDDFAASLQKQFGFRALSATGMAAPIFAASAADVEMTPPVSIAGKPHVMVRLELKKTSPLAQMTVIEVEECYRLSVILLEREGTALYHPPGPTRLAPKDLLAVFGAAEEVQKLVHDSR